MNDPAPHRRRQFSIGALLLATALVAVAASVMGGLLRGEGVDRATFVIWGTAAPVAVLLVVTTVIEVRRYLRKK